MKKFNYRTNDKRAFCVTVIGATGLVGRKVLSEIERLSFPVDKVYLFASEKSDGKTLRFKGNDVTVRTLAEKFIPCDVDFAFFCAGGKVSTEYAKRFIEKGCVVIDNSSVFRLEKDVPLVIPAVNGIAAIKHAGLIANPNCSTISECVALKPLDDAFGLKRVVVSTYQAVSGAGQKGILDLVAGINGFTDRKNYRPEKFDRHVFSDCLPKIDDFTPSLYTKEELKIINETRKILSLEKLRITATAVRVPVFNCHSESVNVELKKPFTENEVRRVLSESPLIEVIDDTKNLIYPSCRDADGKDKVFVGRIRRDYSVKSGLNLWIVSDNLLRGAATNAVEIAKTLAERKNE